MKSGKNSVIRYLIGLVLFGLMILTAVALIGKIVLSHPERESSLEAMLFGVIVIAVTVADTVTVKWKADGIFIPLCILTAAIVSLLLIIAFAIDGNFQNVGYRTISVMIGAAISYVICHKTSGKVKTKRRRYR